MVERIMEVANQRKDSNISKTLAEDVVWVSLHVFQVYIICLLSLWSLSYKMFEAHMDEYLDEETEWVKHAFDVICKGWDQEASLFRDSVSSSLPLFHRYRHHLLLQLRDLRGSWLRTIRPWLSAMFLRHSPIYCCFQ